MPSSMIRYVSVMIIAVSSLALNSPAHAFKSKYSYEILQLCNEKQYYKIRFRDEFYLRKNKAGKLRPGVDIRTTIADKGKFSVSLMIRDPDPQNFYDTINFKYLYLERTKKSDSSWTKWRRISKKWKTAKIKDKIGNPDEWHGYVGIRVKSTKTRQIMIKVRLPSNYHIEYPERSFDLNVHARMKCEDKETVGRPVSPAPSFLNTKRLESVNCRRQNWCLDNGRHYIPGLGCCE